MINSFVIVHSAVTLTNHSRMVGIIGYIIVLIILLNVLLRIYCYHNDLNLIIRKLICSIQESRRDSEKHLDSFTKRSFDVGESKVNLQVQFERDLKKEMR